MTCANPFCSSRKSPVLDRKCVFAPLFSVLCVFVVAHCKRCVFPSRSRLRRPQPRPQRRPQSVVSVRMLIFKFNHPTARQRLENMFPRWRRSSRKMFHSFFLSFFDAVSWDKSLCPIYLEPFLGFCLSFGIKFSVSQKKYNTLPKRLIWLMRENRRKT